MVHLGLNYCRDDKLLPSSMAVLLKLHWVPSTQVLAIRTVSPWLVECKASTFEAIFYDMLV